MNEEEARTKWCPMARVYSPDGAYNKEGGCLAHGSTCIASDCMMWRSRERSHCSVTDGTSCPPAKLDPEHPCIECKWNVIEFKGEGFCGLGGKE
jgi:hypothetical protein